MSRTHSTDIYSAPSWLDQDAEVEWHRLVQTGVPENTDPITLAAYCSSLALWRRVCALTRVFEEHDALSWSDHDGRTRQHPAVAINARLATELVEMAEAIGLEEIELEGHRPTLILVLDEGPKPGIAE